jgi:hypothetical protein
VVHHTQASLHQKEKAIHLEQVDQFGDIEEVGAVAS